MSLFKELLEAGEAVAGKADKIVPESAPKTVEASNVVQRDPVKAPIVEAKKVEPKKAPDDEDLNIPGVSLDNPRYKSMVKKLKSMKKEDPALYNKIINWD